MKPTYQFNFLILCDKEHHRKKNHNGLIINYHKIVKYLCYVLICKINMDSFCTLKNLRENA